MNNSSVLLVPAAKHEKTFLLYNTILRIWIKMDLVRLHLILAQRPEYILLRSHLSNKNKRMIAYLNKNVCFSRFRIQHTKQANSFLGSWDIASYLLIISYRNSIFRFSYKIVILWNLHPIDDVIKMLIW